MRFISKLEIKNGILVKGRQLEGNRKIGDPIKFAEKYFENGVDEIFFFDIVASLYDSNILEDIIKKVCSKIFIPFAVGGGIRNLDDCKKLFDLGADKIHLNSILYKDINLVEKICEIYGSQAVCIEVQIKKIDNVYNCFYDRGREFSGIKLIDRLNLLKKLNWGEIVITDIDKDGMNSGVNFEIIKIVRDNLENRQILYSGGFNPDIDDKIKLKQYLDGVLVASSLHQDKTIIKNFSQRLEE